MSLRFLLWTAGILAAAILLLGFGYCGYDKLREIESQDESEDSALTDVARIAFPSSLLR